MYMHTFLVLKEWPIGCQIVHHAREIHTLTSSFAGFVWTNSMGEMFVLE